MVVGTGDVLRESSCRSLGIALSLMSYVAQRVGGRLRQEQREATDAGE